MKKLPPIQKIYEAYSAIADGRVSLSDTEGNATVKSSGGAKEYTVAWSGSIYTSNDNASYWQGYPGYPVIAVLMLQGKLTLERDIAALFSGINWTELNKKHKRDYAAAVDEVMQERKFDTELVDTAVNQVYSEIKVLTISVKRSLGR